MRSAMPAASQYLDGGPLMWILNLYMHVNQKSDYDGENFCGFTKHFKYQASSSSKWMKCCRVLRVTGKIYPTGKNTPVFVTS